MTRWSFSKLRCFKFSRQVLPRRTFSSGVFCRACVRHDGIFRFLPARLATPGVFRLEFFFRQVPLTRTCRMSEEHASDFLLPGAACLLVVCRTHFRHAVGSGLKAVHRNLINAAAVVADDFQRVRAVFPDVFKLCL